ncbi:unnamed protein product [Callosobruchus maculatus]|uniref:Glucose-methanol-choline oxidoreductase N-terminal domain-containing protein n=1 Tax=Callosobruchus maculatus TaxID=64391 RepID=A0A653BM07_CALMS|nr:unnamed protein product [Callosobruchus maculatus]
MLLAHILATILTAILSSIPTKDLGPLRNVAIKVMNESAELTNAFSHYSDDLPPQTVTEEFDFIVVGASPSGSVLANRLSEIEGWSVLLLEAGGEPSILTRLAPSATAFSSTEYDWGYYAEQQDSFCSGCVRKRVKLPRGKCLGGGSSTNYMIYTRGNKLDYDMWQAMGNPGWSYEDVLPYFLKSEGANIKINDTGYHNKGGPLGVSDVPYRTRSATVFVEAAQEAGYPYVDNNGEHQIGTSYAQATMRNGLRSNAGTSFLRPVRHRKNLRIRRGAHVTKVLINAARKEAYGVEYVKNKKIYTAFYRKEVIISAGSLNSPQLLMLSGIGPKGELERLGGTNSLVWLKTNLTDQDHPTLPDVELIFSPGFPGIDFGLFYRINFNIGDEIYDTLWKPFIGKPVFQVSPMLMHPRSRGRMKLRSSDPFEAPKYIENFFSDRENLDITRIITAVREIQRIVGQPALQKYGAKMIDVPIPGCEMYSFDSDEYWECAMRAVPTSVYHQMGTCRMGPEDDKDTVVDSNLRVHGINSLRVVDLSVVPRPLSGHTVAPAYMIGEKGADIIKNHWGALGV